MAGLNRSVDASRFAMVPKNDMPRSSFVVETGHKTTMDSGYLVPLFVDEVLPGDTFRVNMTAFARLATPIFPVMDNLHFDSFFFYVPYRILQTNFVKLMGERENPEDSIDFLSPVSVTPEGGYAVNSLQDYMGLPTLGMLATEETFEHNTYLLRAYNKIFNDWFRDQNLQDRKPVPVDDGPDDPADFVLLRRNKRHDYITSALPWPQKGEAVTVPLGGTAPVIGDGKSIGFTDTVLNYGMVGSVSGPLGGYTGNYTGGAGSGYSGTAFMFNRSIGLTTVPGNSGLVVDLSDATAATINQLRQSVAVQLMLERDARGGTRYTEILRHQWNVVSPDARLQRAEYLGGGSNPIVFNPIAQTSASDVTGSTTPQGNLSAMATSISNRHGFSQSFTEHGCIIGLVSVRADLTYQQGVRKMWKRRTRLDWYLPVFAHLGEQAVLNYEVYARGTAEDHLVFGYQERWAEYRYQPSMVTGLFRSTSAGTIDNWHLAQRFNTLPLLGDDFIQEKPPVDRVLAVGTAANGQQLIVDTFITKTLVRAMPMYSAPGMGLRL